LWTVDGRQIDLPGRFVARKWQLDRPTNQLLQEKTHAGVRHKHPQVLVRLMRSLQDDPSSDAIALVEGRNVKNK